MPTKTTTEMRRCTGSERFGIAAHDAPIADFPVQPSRKDGLGTMCAPHWKAYVKGLAADRKARLGDGEETNDERAGGMGPDPDAPAAKPTRTKKAPEPKPESPRVRKARETLAATETLGGDAYTTAIGSDEVQAALETVNGHGSHVTDEPDDGQVLVAGVLYDAETLTEAEPVEPAPTLTPRSVRSIHDALVEFGYADLTLDEVRETGDRLLAGGEAGSDIIAMFIRRMLVESGAITEVETPLGETIDGGTEEADAATSDAA
jgi:hypothetical protein